MSLIELNRAKQYANEQLTALIPVLPTKAVTFDNGIYSVPSDIVNGQISDCVLNGQTATNVIKNGNFANGTTDWTSAGATISSVNNVLSVTGNGSSITPLLQQNTNIICSTGKKVFIRAKVKVTNSVCSNFTLRIEGTTNASPLNVNVLNTPAINTVYVLNGIVALSDQTGSLKIIIRHQYADLTTANGKVMEVQEVFALDLTTHGLDTLTADQCNAKFPNWFDGTKSTVSNIRFVSDGKNKFDGKWEPGSINTANGANDDSAISVAIRSGFIKLVKNKTYYLKNYNGLGFNLYRYDLNKSFQSASTSLGSSITVEGFDGYIRFRLLTTDKTIKAQLEEGGTATEYEPYKLSQTYINAGGELRSLLNGTKDEVRATDGQKVQRNNQYILQSGDIVALTTTYTNFDSVSIKKPIDYIGYNKYNNNLKDVVLDGKYTNGTTIGTIDDSGWINNLRTDTNVSNIWFMVAKGTYTSLADAQSKLTGQALIYQLATPIVTKIPQQPPLQVFEGGTVYVEPIGDLAETTLPSITANLPIGDNNKFGVAVHDYQAANADWVLTTNEQKCMILVASNSGANANIILPNVAGRVYMVKNATSYNVVCKSAGAEAGTTILPGNSGIVFNGGV